MIQDDIKFFRQNFSASSLSDFHDTPKKHPLYQTKNRLHVPKPKAVPRESNHQREQERYYQRTDMQYLQSKTLHSKSQYKMLNKLRNQHQQIKHLHPQSQEQSVWVEESDRASQPGGKLKFKASKSQKKEQQEEKRGRNSASELKEEKRDREKQKEKDKEIQNIRESNQMQTEKAKQLTNKIQQKDKLIKKLRNSEQQIVQKYKQQIKHLKGEIDKFVNQNTTLKKEIITKQLQNKELKQQNFRRQNDQRSSVIERQLQTGRDKERQYLQTIRLLQQKQQLPSLPNIELLNQISHLKQVIIDYDIEWQKKLSEALQNERKLHVEAVQRLEAAHFQIPPTPMSEMALKSGSNFEQVSNQQGNQFMRMSNPVGGNSQVPQTPPYYQNNGYPNYPQYPPQYPTHQNPYPNVYIRGPEFEKDRGQRVIELLVSQLQQLRRPANPIEDQLRNIKQSIRALMKRPSELGGKEYKELAVTTDSLQMVSQLQNLKMYIIKQENARKDYNQQLTYYRSQHTILFQENKQLKSQVTSLKQSLDVATLQNDQYNRTVMQLRVKVEEKTRYIQELASSLANIQNNKIDTYTKIKTNVDRQRSHQLETEVQRLRMLLQTEVIQLNKTNDDKLRGLQLHIHNQQKKIKDLQEYVRVATQQVKQKQNQLIVFTNQSTQDIAALRQANQRLQQENISFKTELTSFATNNHHLQTQVKERTHVIDHLWMVKQAQFDNIFGQLARLREGYL